MAGFGSGNVEDDSFMRDYVRAVVGDAGLEFSGSIPATFRTE
jgi:hypothetical protein